MKTYVRFSLMVLALVILTLGLVTAARAGGYFSPRVRVAHAAIGAPAADMYVDNELFFQNIPYRTVAGYKMATEGSHRVRVFPVGTQQPAIPEQNYSFGNNQDYTLVAFGQTSANNLELRSFLDDNTIPTTGQTRVRIIHASPNLSAINICINNQGQCWVSTLAFKNASTYFVTGAGAYNLQVRQTDNTVLWTSPGSLTFNPGVVYTVFLVGLYQGDPGLQFISIADDIRSPSQPPQNGAFLSPEAIVVVTAAGLILLAGIGLTGWRLARRRFY